MPSRRGGRAHGRIQVGLHVHGWWRMDAPAQEVKDHSLATLRRQLAESRAFSEGTSTSIRSTPPRWRAVCWTTRGPRRAARAPRRRSRRRTVGDRPHQAETIRRALDIGDTPFRPVQATWNLLEPSARVALAEAHAAGWGVIVKEALANGRLTDRPRDAATTSARQLAADRGTSLDAVAIAAVLANPWVDVVLSGAATPAQLQSNVTALDLALTPEELERLGSSRSAPTTTGRSVRDCRGRESDRSACGPAPRTVGFRAVTASTTPDWERRILAPVVSMPDVAPAAPDRLVYESTESGVWQVARPRSEDRTRHLVTDHPVGVTDGTMSVDGGRSCTGSTRTATSPVAGGRKRSSAAGPSRSSTGSPTAGTKGWREAPGVVAVGISDREGFAIHVSIDGGPARELFRSRESLRIGGADRGGFCRSGLSTDGWLFCLEHSEHGDLLHSGPPRRGPAHRRHHRRATR